MALIANKFRTYRDNNSLKRAVVEAENGLSKERFGQLLKERFGVEGVDTAKFIPTWDGSTSKKVLEGESLN